MPWHQACLTWLEKEAYKTWLFFNSSKMSVSDAPWPCHLQQLIINLRGIKRKFCVYVSVIDEGDLLFGQMNKSKQAKITQQDTK